MEEKDDDPDGGHANSERSACARLLSLEQQVEFLQKQVEFLLAELSNVKLHQANLTPNPTFEAFDALAEDRRFEFVKFRD